MHDKKVKSPLLAPITSQHFGDVLDSTAAPSTASVSIANSQSSSAQQTTSKVSPKPSHLSLNQSIIPTVGSKHVIAPELAKQFTAPERLALTANGNLQRILSGWHDSSVLVRVLSNALTSSTKGTGAEASSVTYVREVQLATPSGRILGQARSTVVLALPNLIEAIGSGRVGIGQLFKTFGLRPSFALRSARRLVDNNSTTATTCLPAQIDLDSEFVGGMCRRYTLSALGVECDITEWLPCDAFDINDVANNKNNRIKGGVETSDRTSCKAAASDSHFGDIMSGTLTHVTVVDSGYQFTPLERVLLSANGNMVRLLSSYLNRTVSVRVLRLEQVDVSSRATNTIINYAGRVFVRQVALVCDAGFRGPQDDANQIDSGITGTVVVEATSKICIEDDRLLEAIEQGQCAIGADMFRFLDVIPEFNLRKFSKCKKRRGVEEGENSVANNDDREDEELMLFREYTLSATGVRIDLEELIDVAGVAHCLLGA